ncbi:MAG: hypothetical protein WCJ35_13100 [Planctomycetota bacterium]
MTATKHLESVGHLCQVFQRPYAAVRRALDEIGAQPALVINGVAHYAEGDVERVGERLQPGKLLGGNEKLVRK